MRNLIFIAMFLIAPWMTIGQNQFKVTFSNLKNDIDVKVNYKVLKDDQSVFLNDSLAIPSRAKIEKIIRVKHNQILEINPISSNNLFLKVTRTNNELKSTLPIEGNSPLNINIIQLENLKNASIDVAQLMEELNTNGILRKLLDTTDVIIDNKIRIGSFLIYDETNKKYIEVFEPTNIWYDRKNVEVFNQNDEVLSKTTTKNSIASAGINLPKILTIGGTRASSNYFDFRWKVYNFREEKFGVANETPQTLFKKYPDFTGYALLKNLVLNVENTKYKVLFVSAWSLTDSIVTFVDSYVGVNKGVEFDISYPPSGTMVFGIDGKAAFNKANSEFRASIKKNVYNYFEVSDITASALQQINKEIQTEKENKREEFRKSQINMMDETLKKMESDIISMYNALINIDKRYIKTEEINVILQIPLFNRSIQEIPDTLDQEKKEQIVTQNLESQICNSFIEYLTAKKQEFNKVKNMKDDFIFTNNNIVLALEQPNAASSSNKKMTKKREFSKDVQDASYPSENQMVLELEKQIDASINIRKMTNEEFKALIDFTGK